MASRSSTGVIVALVVFVVLSVALLAVSIILYADKSTSDSQASEAKADLEKYVREGERGSDEVKAMLQRTSGASLYAYMQDQSQDLAEFVSGNRAADMDAMRSALKDLELGEKDTIKSGVVRLAQDRDARKADADRQKAKASDLQKQVASLQSELDAKAKEYEASIAKFTGSIGAYGAASEEYRKDFEKAREDLANDYASMKQRFEADIEALQTEIDSLRADRSRLGDRIEALRRKVDATSMKAGNPAALVDATVLDFDPNSSTLFIDIGSNKRVVPGMTFEVFDDAAGIAAAAEDEEGSRGKASIQVLKVGDKTSTCRVIRGVSSRPVLKGDVVANAVFNPAYRFKFLVHGKFDANGDGRPTNGEADFVKARIAEWGGDVVDGNELTGDIDFLVLGALPPKPVSPSADATEAQMLAYSELLSAREVYDALFRTAVDAEIPVLNWSRFETLTGSVDR